MAEYEEIKKSDRVNSAGRASYIERNQWMIDESNIIVFHLNKRQVEKSGSIAAFQYTKDRRKVITIYD